MKTSGASSWGTTSAAAAAIRSAAAFYKYWVVGTAAPEFIGLSGSGSFTQSGGINNPSDYNGAQLYLGYNAGSFGSYALSGSSVLNCLGSSATGQYGKEYIGAFGAGVFNQTGGTNNNDGYIYLANTGGTGNTGTYNLNGGLLITAVIQAGGGTAAFNINGGTLELTKGNVPPFGLPSVLMPLTLGSSGGGTFESSGTTGVFSGAISGPGSLTVVGTGMIILGAANTYSGNTLISGGTLQLGSSLALQQSTLDTSGAGMLSFGTLASATVGGLTGPGPLALKSSASAGLSLSVGNNGTSTTCSGALSGTGSLTKIGSGQLTLAGSNTYAGNTTITRGHLTDRRRQRRLRSCQPGRQQ